MRMNGKKIPGRLDNTDVPAWVYHRHITNKGAWTMKRIGILTGGGDAPGLNAVIRAAVKTAINEYGCEVFGIRESYDGFIEEGGVIPLGMEEVRGILPRGGTILGTANRGNPYMRK